jgi:hypothetical protein
MTIGRRPLFFSMLAIVNLVLVPATPAEFRWLNYSMAVLAVFWAIALALEDLAHTKRDEREGGSP